MLRFPSPPSYYDNRAGIPVPTHSTRNQGREIVGATPAIAELRRRVALAGPSEGRVLVTGEHGTGKELVARSIHLQSPRRHRLFLEVNCAAVPEDLVESELFGHERGAFTGAVGLRRGKFELADGGTLFFDEVGSMSLRTQGALLRVIERPTFTRVGGSDPATVDVRIVAATNRRLEELIAAGSFREDLYYRLAVIPLHLPPLRERADAVPLLAGHFLRRLCARSGRPPKRLAPGALAALRAYSWPGNVRELRNCIERLVIMVPGDEIRAADLGLPGTVRPGCPAAPPADEEERGPGRLARSLEPPPRP